MKRQRLESIVTGIKSSNKEYYKIKEKAKENMKSVSTNGKLLLKFATLSVIESVRTNTKLYNFAIYDISTTNNTITTSHESNSLSLMSGPQHQQSFNGSYTALILEEAEKLYNDLTTELTDRVIAATVHLLRHHRYRYHLLIVTIFYKQRIGSCITMRVLSVNVGLPRQVVFNGQIVTTSIFKDPVKGPIMLRKLNVDGDRQADLTVHGGLDKAVYSYPAEHYEYYWRKQFPNMDLTWGMFGENFNTEGLMEDDVNVGDQFQIGSATKIIATQPRMPCYKLGVRFGRMDVIRRFMVSGRPGIYFKVLQEGQVKAGDNIKIIRKDENNVTVKDIVRLYIREGYNDEDIETMRRATKIEDLPAGWRDEFEQKIEQLERK